jgi:NAD+ kinase
MIKSVALFGSENGRVTREYCTQIVKKLLEKEIVVYLHEQLGDKIDDSYKSRVISYCNIFQSKINPDIVLSVGGDGTFLETILQVRDTMIPVAGINAGRLGFLANIDDFSSSIDSLIKGEYNVVERNLIELIAPHRIMGRSNVALNDITIQKADLNMISIKVFVDDSYLNTYWADGLIVSTATGSTAYNLSTGGPILTPEADNIIISPLSPHNLAVRPIILPGSSKLKLVLSGRSPEFLVTCDFRSVRVPFFRELIIAQANYRVRTINLSGSDFFSTLRNKLMWGADPRN